jgi:hypothetical protein
MDDSAIARAIGLSDAIIQDTRSYKDSILLAQLTSAREEAIEATRQLLTASPHDAQKIMELQNEVKRFAELVTWIQNAHQDARDAFGLLPQDEQAEVLAFLNPKTEINDA